MKRCSECDAEFESQDWLCPDCGYMPPQLDGVRAHALALAKEGGGFRPEAFSELAELEAGNFWFRSRNRLISWAMRRHLPEMQRYLEIGCGTGFVLTEILQSFPGIKATGSEIFSAGLPHAAKRVGDTELIQMDARDVPYASEFDGIGAFDVLEHIDEDETVLTEMFRALKAGGCIAVTVPQHPWLWSHQDEYACHKRRYQVGELARKVRNAGFTVELETSFVTLLLPAMYLSRLRQSKPADEFGTSAELRLPPLLNRIFEVIMGVERRLIEIGLRFPIGGSLLILAKKPEGET